MFKIIGLGVINGPLQIRPISDMDERGLYKLKSRNLHVGIWTGEGFVGIREKFGERFLFMEFYGKWGTVMSMEPLNIFLPPEIELAEWFLIDGTYTINKPLFDFLEEHNAFN